MGAFRLGKKLSPTDELPRLHELETIAAPWVSVESVNQADNEVLENLLGRCRQLEQHWLGHDLHMSGRSWKWLLLAAIVAAAACGVVYLGMQNNDSPIVWLRKLQDYATGLRFAFIRASLFEKIAGITFLLVLVSIRLLAFKR